MQVSTSIEFLLPRKGAFTLLFCLAQAQFTLFITLPEEKVLSHLSMVFETPGGLSSGKIPQTQGLVPRSRKSVVSVTGENYVRDEVRVAVQSLLGYAVISLVSRQFPYDEGLVCKYNKTTFQPQQITSNTRFRQMVSSAPYPLAAQESRGKVWFIIQYQKYKE